MRPVAAQNVLALIRTERDEHDNRAVPHYPHRRVRRRLASRFFHRHIPYSYRVNDPPWRDAFHRVRRFSLRVWSFVASAVIVGHEGAWPSRASEIRRVRVPGVSRPGHDGAWPSRAFGVLRCLRIISRHGVIRRLLRSGNRGSFRACSPARPCGRWRWRGMRQAHRSRRRGRRAPGLCRR